MRPRVLLRAEALPRTPLGKLERVALAELACRRLGETTE
jgi:acyl-coenzyme A synthetase/AMP-(fatty) acid ligase